MRQVTTMMPGANDGGDGMTIANCDSGVIFVDRAGSPRSVEITAEIG
ncbi:MAG: hypothetical protein I3J03_01870 [Actinomyces succiniciruminis]|nr:hypothetical protein [Actinomyces succiniciruminis]